MKNTCKMKSGQSKRLRGDVFAQGSPRFVKGGFTLAEVLITLAVIGVVAALTLPTLVENHREKATVSKLKKSYSTINQAYVRALYEHGDLWDWGFAGDSSTSSIDPETGERKYDTQTIANSKLFLDTITEHMSNVTKCYQPLCDISYYNQKTLAGVERAKGAALNIVDLPDGTSLLGGWIVLSTCKNGSCGDFGVDINGSKKLPNTIGIDLFFFNIRGNKLVPYGNTAETIMKFPLFCNTENRTSGNNGQGCAAWVIFNENMDYLHCNDLSWSGKRKCK